MLRRPPKRDTHPLAPDGRRDATRRRRLGAAGLSIVSHLLIFLVVLSVPTKPLEPEPQPMTVALVALPRPAPKPARPAAHRAAIDRRRPRRSIARRAPPRPDVVPLTADEAQAAQADAGLSDAQLAGASAADSGAPGGACDMARRVQSALRRDPLVQAAVAGSAGKAIMVWNGDWVRSGGEDGKGLAAVREAILWEVGFAPEACRAQPVHGLVLLSLGQAPGAPRLAVGLDEWRWSDLLGRRPPR
jgi:hypothetical protein